MKLKSVMDLLMLDKRAKSAVLDEEDLDIINLSKENHEVIFGQFNVYDKT